MYITLNMAYATPATTIVYSDFAANSVQVDASAFDNSAVGEYEIEVSYEGKTDSFTVTVVATVTGLEVLTLPTVTVYDFGVSQLNFAGISVRISDDFGSNIDLSYATDDFDQNVDFSYTLPQTATTVPVLVEYKIDNNVYDSFEVTLVRVLSGVSVSAQPTKLVYEVGETVDLSGGVLGLKYNDNTTSTLSMTDSEVSVSGFDSSVASTARIVTLSYGGFDAQISVTITEPVPSVLRISASSTHEDWLNVDSAYGYAAEGLQVEFYDGDTTTQLTREDYEVDVSAVTGATMGGEYPVIVSGKNAYAGYNCQYVVTALHSSFYTVSSIAWAVEPISLNITAGSSIEQIMSEYTINMYYYSEDYQLLPCGNYSATNVYVFASDWDTVTATAGTGKTVTFYYGEIELTCLVNVE